jgi:hypothetical protein
MAAAEMHHPARTRIAWFAIGLVLEGTFGMIPSRAMNPPAPAAEARPAARGERLKDGSVFLPKPAQFALRVQTELAQSGQHRQRWPLVASLIPDPGAHAVVAAPQAGVLALTDELAPGLAVKRGQVLAELVVSLAGAKQAALRGELASVIQKIKIKEQDIVILKFRVGNQVSMVGDTVILKQFNEELTALERRRDALESTLARRIALRAPIDGILAVTPWRDGERLDVGQTVFELLDPQRQWLEATAWQPLPAGAAPVATLPASGKPAPVLEFVHAGVAGADGARPLYFRLVTPMAPSRHRFGALLDTEVEVGDPLAGIAVDSAAVVREADGRQVVWVQEQAERFVARSVHPQRLDAVRWLLSATDVAPGERIVTQGAWMLSQFH